ncbi:MAG: peptide chain release factor N(5)-glutamine methyltransferase [Rickettsiaceae bacterium]
MLSSINNTRPRSALFYNFVIFHMQIQKVLSVASARLTDSTTPALDSRILLSYILNISREQLLMRYSEELDHKVCQAFWDLVQRRLNKEPIAYIIGKQEFYGREYCVNKHVLIPRPETELLIDKLIIDYAAYHSTSRVDILELGVGSGAISISIATEIPKANIIATDICAKALKVAMQNVTYHNVGNRVKLIQSNWYKEVPDMKCDYIVSNPPYIANTEKDLVCLQTDLFEPKIALYAEEDGLSEYKLILKTAKHYLKQGGRLLLEIGCNQAHQVQNIALLNGFNDICLHQDLAGHDRLIICTL